MRWFVTLFPHSWFQSRLIKGYMASELAWIWRSNNNHVQRVFFNRVIFFFLNTVTLTLYLDIRLSSLSEKDFVGSDIQKQIKLLPGTMPA